MPVDTLLGQQARRPSKWRALLAWQDWRLPVKLAAISFVPLLIAVVLGTIAIVGQAQQAGRLDRVEAITSLSTRLHTVLGDLQRERAVTAELLSRGTPGGSAELRDARAALDSTSAGFGSQVKALELEQGSRLAERAADASAALGKLAGIRDAVAGGQLDAATAISRYGQIGEALLDLDTALVAEVNASGLAARPSASHNLAVAGEMLAIERGLIGYGIERSALTPSSQHTLRSVETRLRQRLGDFRVMATQQQLNAFTAAVPAQSLRTRQQLVSAVLNGTPSAPESAVGNVSAQQWNHSAGVVAGGLAKVSTSLDDELVSTAEELAGDATAAVVALAIALLLAFVLAALVGFVISRQLLRSVRQLRSTAVEVAQERLPAVVHSMQQGDTSNTAIGAVPVRSADELGQLARAFDDVYGQAVRLAADQAAMRTAYGNVFVNLSRRSQSLVQRQLQLIERLERDEEDADQLATLFQLDHLATRMRRNNENLLVLSGGESGRRSGQPVTVTDVLRAAVSEIEQYQRVAVRAAPDARVVGHAASDLMRLLAELLDNATAFSAPDTHVTLATRFTEDRSLSIDVLDKGIGMSAAEVEEANSRMAEAASVDLTTSRRMGLFVVGRLASKHGFRVVLYGGRDITGVRANVLIPAHLLAGAPGVAPPPVPQQPPSPGNGALPQPSRQSNGSGNSIARSLPGSQNRATTASAADAGGAAEPPPSENEASGTALFTPIGADDAAPPPPQPPAPEQASAQAEQQEPQEQPSTQVSEAPEAEVPETEIPETETPEAETPEAGAPAAAANDGGTDQRERSEPASGGRQDDLPVGQELFAANATSLTQWWTAATKAHDKAERETQDSTSTPGEATPIFNEMLSAWFQDSGSGAAGEQESSGDAAAAAAASTAGWEFAADASRRTVESVSRTEPKSYTEAGLPRRRRGEQLLPGSAGSDSTPVQEPETAAKAGPSHDRQLPVRDPADVRSRLSSFQRGVSRGKRQRDDEPTGDDGSLAQPPLPQSRKSVESTDSAGPQPDSSDATGSWSFASDERLREVRSVSGTQPGSYTEAGLPRRRRGEQLLPGSATKAEAVPGPRTERNPENVRGRLSSFQQGIRKGRHQTTQPTDGNHDQMEGE